MRFAHVSHDVQKRTKWAGEYQGSEKENQKWESDRQAVRERAKIPKLDL